jgi:hypothetical protein
MSDQMVQSGTEQATWTAAPPPRFQLRLGRLVVMALLAIIAIPLTLLAMLVLLVLAALLAVAVAVSLLINRVRRLLPRDDGRENVRIRTTD